jgi:hypothetical protein
MRPQLFGIRPTSNNVTKRRQMSCLAYNHRGLWTHDAYAFAHGQTQTTGLYRVDLDQRIIYRTIPTSISCIWPVE